MLTLLRSRMFTCFVALALLIGLSVLPQPTTASSPSDVLYGVNSRVDGLFIIDPENGNVTDIGPLDLDPNKFTTPVAMAIRPSDGTIFVWNNSGTGGEGVLLTVDPGTGQATIVNPSAEPQGQLSALAFSPDGTLYGIDYELFTIDTSAGNITLVGDLRAGFFRVAAADFDASGTLYGVEVNGIGEREELVTVNTTTGAASTVAELSQDIGVIGSIVFDADGKLIGSGAISPYQEDDILFEIDKLSGVVSNIKNIEWDFLPQGMGFAPSAAGNQPPVINSVTASPDQLWPPNHKPVDVTITVDATDPDGPEDIVRITYSVADEYGEYDVDETDLPEDGVISLIAERDGKDKDGRVYTITITVYDAGGLSDVAVVEVIVGHDMGK